MITNIKKTLNEKINNLFYNNFEIKKHPWKRNIAKHINDGIYNRVQEKIMIDILMNFLSRESNYVKTRRRRRSWTGNSYGV